ncbi:MAG: GGDEF domain-containing protein [Sphingomonas sp.]|uniref:diguanylate cyclase n=1 Tax=Sphingomonas adhaesiva TaxID=28212 RepID=A0A2A4I7I2_9SPHN|nr:GGDEF domain-containing protein [Sphingomonas adhaesiva]PZU77811.1 MAG: GGDEF domain-containing protein [Sphingomonas sp.]
MVAGKTDHAAQASTGDRLFAKIGAFLTANRLSPDPAHYSFAHAVLANADGLLARRVAEITDGGVRLTAQDIVRLGGQAITGAPVAGATDADNDDDDDRMVADPATHQAMIERVLMQIAGFDDTITIAHAEANNFGRDLERSAAQMRDVGPAASAEEIGRLTNDMIARVHQAEERLDAARRETEELRAALDEARGSARTDPLTELPNRRAFDETFAGLDRERPVAVAICDIDHFKNINDNFGHAVGDRVIRAVAHTLASECGCLVARYGGEEFALLFDRIGLDEAAERIESARQAITARRLRVRETGELIGTVSFSAGVAEGCPGEGRAALMLRADAALYRAKDQGRARTITAPHVGETCERQVA